MKLFETHCHLDFPDYKNDRDIVIKKAINEGVEYFINVGIDTDSNQAGIDLAEKYDNFYASAGYHPNYADKYDEKALRRFLIGRKVKAVGEIGLDYYRNYTSKDMQKDVFEKQLIIAEELKKPVIVHCRDAYKDCWKLLGKYNLNKVVFHCYAGDLNYARQIWDKGWMISVTAAITFKNCRLNDVIEACPLDRIMTETDSPFMAPQHKRGKRNDPSSISYVVNRISEIKQLPPLIVSAELFANACNFFLKD